MKLSEKLKQCSQGEWDAVTKRWFARLADEAAALETRVAELEALTKFSTANVLKEKCRDLEQRLHEQATAKREAQERVAELEQELQRASACCKRGVK